MSVFTGTVFDKDTPTIVRVSRTGMAIVLVMLLLVHGMILAI